MIKDELTRPKLYLLLCLVALLFEVGFMIVKVPPACARCHNPFSSGAGDGGLERSKDLPEFCQPCVEAIRGLLGADTTPHVAYDPPYPIDATDPIVVLDTSRGVVVVELFRARAPKSVANFLTYAHTGSYDGVIFHRIEYYLANTGRHRADLSIITQLAPIPSESHNGLQNLRGTLSLPRQNDDQNSATSDFFFNLQDNPTYDWHGDSAKLAGYCVFGQVIAGYDVVDGTKRLPVVEKAPYPGWERLPRENIVIRRVTVVRE
ncbi:MAG TPA: peptidylprolyl isomerase [Planctomycetota bacterium]|nr:peptidylprolyl isomerase [Planctomycetota bacterium]